MIRERPRIPTVCNHRPMATDARSDASFSRPVYDDPTARRDPGPDHSANLPASGLQPRLSFGPDRKRALHGEQLLQLATDITSTAPSGRVGVPIEEAALTALIWCQPDRVLPGHSDPSTTLVLHEVELGVGRPDIVVLRVDLAALTFRRHALLRLKNLTEARALGAALEGDLEMAGVSPRHAGRVVNGLRERGWLDHGVISRVVQDSVLIEAKVEHWGLGIGQLARVRWAANHAALLVPGATAGRIPERMLRFNQIGLLSGDAGVLVWQRFPPRRDLPIHLDAWLGELALRAVEAG